MGDLGTRLFMIGSWSVCSPNMNTVKTVDANMRERIGKGQYMT